jgi:hypothetical protein
MASMASATPIHESVPGRSPCRRPNTTGTLSPIKLNTGAARLMGPSARARYIKETLAAPQTPAAGTPQEIRAARRPGERGHGEEHDRKPAEAGKDRDRRARALAEPRCRPGNRRSPPETEESEPIE